jgi:hypothetical protein
VVEAHIFFGQRVKPETTADSRRWSFYTALHVPSSIYAREVQVHFRLKNCGRDTAANVDKWRGMADECVWKGMVAIAVRFAVCEQAGW